jgi:hypothetical protein
LQDRENVKKFLIAVKETIANPVAERGWVLVPRLENKECLLELGFKYQHVQETLLGLSVEDYCDGPCLDRDQPGELWIFGKTIENRPVYIKVKLASLGTLSMVRVLSFHFAENALLYPFKETKEKTR